MAIRLVWSTRHESNSLVVMHSVEELTESQKTAIAQFSDFLDSNDRAFLLTGAAGTGKTHVLRHLTDELRRRNLPYALAAPTGRAARVLQARTGLEARTIHATIYAFDTLEQDVGGEAEIRFHFGLREAQRLEFSVLIVDEASMVGDKSANNEILRFGSGRLLNDLLQFVFSGDPGRSHRRIVFVGDPFQLPPIGDSASRALDPDYLANAHNVASRATELGDVVRQKTGSQVLALAADLRDALSASNFLSMRLNRPGFDVRVIEPSDLIDRLVASNPSDAIAVVRTNESALRINRVIRERIHGVAGPQPDDRIVVVQNCRRTGLNNGQFGVIVHADSSVERRKVNGEDLAFRGAQIEMEEPDGTTITIEAKLFDPLLESREAGLTPRQQGALFADFRLRHPELDRRSEEFAWLLQSDPYVNALRVKYGWAVTCHKAQGGEWPEVLVHFERWPSKDEEGFRWTYTAITRASRVLSMVNPPDFGPGAKAAARLEQRDTSRAALEAEVRVLLQQSGAPKFQWHQNSLRCTITNDASHAVADIFVKADGSVSTVTSVGRATSEDAQRALLDALAPISGWRPTSTEPDPPLPEPVARLLALIRTRVEAEGGTVGKRHHQYQVQLDLTRAEESASVRIFYKKTGEITHAEPSPTSHPRLVALVDDALRSL